MRAPGALLLTYAIFLTAWVFTNPVAGSPDELDHFVRAQSVARGQFVGSVPPSLSDEALGQPPVEKTCCIIGNATALDWVRRGAREVDVPRRLSVNQCRGLAIVELNQCLRSGPPPADQATDLTLMGTIEPVPYLGPGLAANLAGSPLTGIRLARAVNAALTLAMLAVAVTVLWSGTGDGLSLAGLLLAVTPMVLFVGASPSSSAIEVSSSIAFVTTLLRVARGGTEPRRVWILLALSGGLLASSRSLGPVWVVLFVATVVGLAGPRRLWRQFRDGGGWAAGALAVVGAACAGTAAWELAVQPRIRLDVGFALDQVGPTVAELPRKSRELIGVFGSIDVHMPAVAYAAWTVGVLVLVSLALLVGTRCQRLVVGGVIAASLAVFIGISAGVLRQYGFGIQGRHVLAFMVLIPLLAGEIVFSRREHFGALRPVWLPAWLGLLTSSVLALGVYTNARVRAVGDSGPLFFAGASRLSPPGGWLLWVTVIAAGLVAGVVAGVLAASARGGEPAVPDGA